MTHTAPVRARVGVLFGVIALLVALAAVPAGAAGKTVVMKDNVFSPNAITVAAGDTVVWRNDGKVAHTVTAGDGSFSSGSVAPGASFQHTFTQPGTFSYRCTFHPGMSGNVVVQAAGPVPSTSTSTTATTRPPPAPTTTRPPGPGATTTTR